MGLVRRPPVTLKPSRLPADEGGMHGTDTRADHFGVLLWILQAVLFATWAVYSLARDGGRPVGALLALLAFTAALLAYRRARSLRAG